MPTHDVFEGQIRLLILRSLFELGGYTANDSMLEDIVERWGLAVTRDIIRTQLSWLQEQGLISVVLLGDTMIAKLTSRGSDVATGKARVPGVKRPRA